MNQKALINDREYAFLELLPSLDGNETVVFCANERGEKMYAQSSYGAAAYCARSRQLRLFLIAFGYSLDIFRTMFSGCSGAVCGNLCGQKRFPSGDGFYAISRREAFSHFVSVVL